MTEKLSQPEEMPGQEGGIEKEKPAVLYHASPSKGVKEFEPRSETVRDPDEGEVVFGTPDRAYASMFIVPADDEWCQIGTSDDNTHTIIISDEKRFKKLDKGGAIYSLPSDTFETDAEKSKTGREWTSTNAVKPTGETTYKKGLQAMLENNVQVYFVDKKTFEAIKKAEDHGQQIVGTLESENQKQERKK